MLYFGIFILLLLLGVGIKISNKDRKKLTDKDLNDRVNEVFMQKIDIYIREYNIKIEEILSKKLESFEFENQYKFVQKQIELRQEFLESKNSSYQVDKVHYLDRNSNDELDILTQNLLSRSRSISKDPYSLENTYKFESFSFHNNRMGDIISDERDTRILNDLFKKNSASDTSQTVS